MIGTVKPTLIEVAAGKLSREKDPKSRLLSAAGFLNLPNSWPAAVLRLGGGT